MHLRNIACIVSIFEVTKWDISNDSNDWQSSNIWNTSVTAEVSKLDKSNEIKVVHLTNMAAIVLTFEVEKFVISKFFNL